MSSNAVAVVLVVGRVKARALARSKGKMQGAVGRLAGLRALRALLPEPEPEPDIDEVPTYMRMYSGNSDWHRLYAINLYNSHHI